MAVIIIDSSGHFKINWSTLPIINVFGKKGSGKSVFLETGVTSIFEKDSDGEIKNVEKVKVIDLWNPQSIGRFEGVYMAFPSKQRYARYRNNNVYGIPLKIVIPNSLDVPERLPMNPKLFMKENIWQERLNEEKSSKIRHDDITLEKLENADMDFQIVTIPYKQLTGAELCLRYGRQETELAIGIVDRVIDHMKEDEGTIYLADELRRFLSGKARTSITGLKSKALNTFLTKEIADMRSRRGVIALIKPLIEERMLASETFKYNLNWEEEIRDLNKITVLCQSFLDFGTALMFTYWSLRKITDVCSSEGLRVVVMIREVTDIAPAYPNPLFPQQFFGSLIMERLVRQMRERVACIFDTQRQKQLIESVKTQADCSVYFRLLGEDLNDANRHLNPMTGKDFTIGWGRYPPISRLGVGQCYIYDNTKTENGLSFHRRILMPKTYHWDKEKSFFTLWSEKGFPMTSNRFNLVNSAIEDEIRKADDELYEKERKTKEELTVEEAKIKAEIEIEKDAQENYVLKLRNSVNPQTGRPYTNMEIAETVGTTEWTVRKILSRPVNASV